MKPGETDLTPEQLAYAFRHLRRPGSPQTMQAALDHPTFGKCLRGLARQFSREGRPAAASYRPPTPAGAPPLPPTPTHPPQRMKSPQARAPRFDARKAAANDLDD